MTELPPDKPLTLGEVAAAAGVSVSTVSKVLNRRADVAPATRERVERVLRERGYVVNRAGRSLRQGRSRQIDFVSWAMDSYYAFEILQGVEEALEPTDVRAVLASVREGQPPQRHWLGRLADGSTDGAVLVLAHQQSPHLQELRRRRVPFVVVDRLGELGPEDLSVSAANWAGGKAATEHLLALGHRRVAALLGPPAYPSSRDRLAGYRAALDAAGIPVDLDLVRHGDFHVDVARREMVRLLDVPDRPTAVFAGNDEQALGVYRALHDRGMRVPEDVSVVGFDDMPFAAWVTPALTTVRQPLREMGRTAAKMLLRVIAGEPVDHVRVELATPLIARASSAPPRRGA